MIFAAHCLLDPVLHEQLCISKPDLALALMVADDEDQALALLSAHTQVLNAVRPLPAGHLSEGIAGLGLLDAAPAVYVLSMNSVDCPLARLDGPTDITIVGWRTYRSLSATNPRAK